jgi:type IV pilus assembly protein PilC
MEFRCRLGTATGEVLEGVYVAESEARLRHDLEEKGLLLLAVQRKGFLPISGLSLPTRRRVGTREFLVFNQELATLLRAGMPLVQSLNILRQRVANPQFRSILDDVHERVRAGSALSEAFAAHGAHFSGIYTASLLAGEKSGGLEQVIRRYVAYTKVVGAVKRKTLSALVYPAILLALSLIVVSIIVLRVVPEFGAFYDSFGAELPTVTRMIVRFSGFLSNYYAAILVALLVAAGALWLWLQQPGQRVRLDRLVLRLPLAGSTARKLATSQLARTLATLLGGGIPLVSALDIASRSIGNRYLAQQLESVSQRVREGESLAAALLARGEFPDVAIKMVEVGEQTGALQDMLNSLADFYDEEIETNLGRFVTLVEPLLLVVMGLVIAGLLLALYMPLFQLSSVMG